MNCMKSQHTPGPWRVVYRTFTAAVCKEGVGAIAELGGKVREINTVEDSEQMRADASLMAAAPELFSALEVCAEVIGHNSCTDGRTPNGFVIALEKARAAIAKAKGEA